MVASLTADDVLGIQNLLGNYCMYVDDGDGEDWASLYTADGSMSGLVEETLRGKQLEDVPARTVERLGGACRHQITNPVIDPGERDGTATVRAYGLVTDWTDGGAFYVFARYRMSLVREGFTWKIRENVVRLDYRKGMRIAAAE